MTEDVSREDDTTKMTNTNEPIVSQPADPGTVKQPSMTLAPSFAQEDQERVAQELPAVEVIGPPGFASPDPATQTGKLVAIEEHPLSDELAEDYGLSVANRAEVVTSSPLTGGGHDATELPDDTSEMTKADLQAEAKARGLARSGTKDEIEDRIREYDANPPSEENDDEDDD